MSNITQFPEPDEYSGSRNVKKKLKRRNRTRLYKVLIVIAVLGAILLSYYIYENTKVFTEHTVTQRVEKIKYDEVTVMNLQRNILSYSKDGANLMTPDGKNLWNITFDMQNPMVATSNGSVCFADHSGNKVYVVNQKNESFEITTDKPVVGISVSEAGYVVAILEDVDVSWIYMYDMNGRVIAYFRTTMEKSGYPVTAEVSPSGEIVAVSYYYLDTMEKKSTVAFYNFGDVGQNNIDNYVSGYNYKDEFVPLIRFMSDDRSFALTTDRLAVFDGAHKPVSISDLFLQEHVLSVYSSDSYIGLVTECSDKDDKYKLDLYNNSGALVSSVKFNYDYQGVEIGSESLVIYGDNNFTVAGLKGDIRYTGIYEEGIDLIYPLADVRKLVVVTDTSVDTIELK